MKRIKLYYATVIEHKYVNAKDVKEAKAKALKYDDTADRKIDECFAVDKKFWPKTRNQKVGNRK